MNVARYLKVLLLCLVLLSALVSTAGATPVTVSNIVNFADTVVPEGTTAENVIVVGGNATIAGVVTDEVVVLNGNVKLTSTAKVRDRVTVLGGNFSTEDGAYVGEGVVRIGGDFAMAETLISAGLFVLLLWFINIVVTAGLIVIPITLAWGFKNRVQEMGDIIRTQTLRTILVGLLGGLAVDIAALILALTIIGIPVALLLILLAGLVSIYGLSGVCCELGRALPLNVPAGERGVFFITLYGAVLLALVFNVPLIGLIVLKLSLMTGFGVVIVRVFTRKKTQGDIADPIHRT